MRKWLRIAGPVAAAHEESGDREMQFEGTGEVIARGYGPVITNRLALPHATHAAAPSAERRPQVVERGPKAAVPTIRSEGSHLWQLPQPRMSAWQKPKGFKVPAPALGRHGSGDGRSTVVAWSRYDRIEREVSPGPKRRGGEEGRQGGVAKRRARATEPEPMVRATEPVPRAKPTPVARIALPFMLPSSEDMSRLMQARVGIRPSQAAAGPGAPTTVVVWWASDKGASLALSLGDRERVRLAQSPNWEVWL